MNDCVVVKTKAELKSAIEAEASKIIITDPDLASNIKIIKTTSKAVLAVAIGSAGLAATNIWNPIGWGIGTVGFVASGSTLTAVVALGIGATLLYAIYSDYNIKAKATVTTPDGSKVDAEIIMEKKKKKK